MRKNDYLHKIYEKNPDTGNYIVEISLDRYTDIFNDWDHSSIMKRDIDPGLRLFFEGCSADIPLKYGIDISFHIAHETQNKQIEEKIIQKLKSYYSMQIRLKERYLKESYRRTVTYILASLVLIITSIILEGNKLDSILFKTLSTGLDIGGWVFLWEAISFFFFKRHKVYHRGRENRRFINANIYFKYELKTKTSPA